MVATGYWFTSGKWERLGRVANCSSLTAPNFTQKLQQDATVYQNFISYLYEAQTASGNTPPIIRSLKLH